MSLIRVAHRLTSRAGRVIAGGRTYRSRGGIYVPELSQFLPKQNNVVARLYTPHGVRIIIGANDITTTGGDVYYAMKAAAETPDAAHTFNRMEMWTGGTTGTGKLYGTAAGQFGNGFTQVGSAKAFDATYPKRNDGDTDNTSLTNPTRTTTYLTSFLTSEVNGTIAAGLITKTSPVNGDELLTGFALSSFTKTSSDTLKVFVNHTMT